MSSFTFSFKPWLLAIAIFAAVEIGVYRFLETHVVDRGSILELSFSRSETPQRVFVYHKLRSFAGAAPTFVMSGDSSGFYGINPLEVAEHLPPGHEMYNLSCCANLGFNGYLSVLEYMITAAGGAIGYVILHVTPYTMPRPETWYGDGAALWGHPDITTFGDAVRKTVEEPIRYLNVPSLAYRREVTSLAYNIAGLVQERPLASFQTYPQFLEMFERTRGWTPENDIRVSVPATECDIKTYDVLDFATLRHRSPTEIVLERYAEMAERHGAELVVVFHPVACVTGPANLAAREEIDRFRAANPDVHIPFPLITTWPSERFSVPAHVTDEWRPATSRRLGEALAGILEARAGTREQR